MPHPSGPLTYKNNHIINFVLITLLFFMVLPLLDAMLDITLLGFTCFLKTIPQLTLVVWLSGYLDSFPASYCAICLSHFCMFHSSLLSFDLRTFCLFFIVPFFPSHWFEFTYSVKFWCMYLPIQKVNQYFSLLLINTRTLIRISLELWNFTPKKIFTSKLVAMAFDVWFIQFFPLDDIVTLSWEQQTEQKCYCHGKYKPLRAGWGLKDDLNQCFSNFLTQLNSEK